MNRESRGGSIAHGKQPKCFNVFGECVLCFWAQALVAFFQLGSLEYGGPINSARTGGWVTFFYKFLGGKKI